VKVKSCLPPHGELEELERLYRGSLDSRFWISSRAQWKENCKHFNLDKSRSSIPKFLELLVVANTSASTSTRKPSLARRGLASTSWPKTFLYSTMKLYLLGWVSPQTMRITNSLLKKHLWPSGKLSLVCKTCGLNGFNARVHRLTVDFTKYFVKDLKF